MWCVFCDSTLRWSQDDHRRVHCCFTSTETIRTLLTSASTFTQLLSSEGLSLKHPATFCTNSNRCPSLFGKAVRLSGWRFKKKKKNAAVLREGFRCNLSDVFRLCILSYIQQWKLLCSKTTRPRRYELVELVKITARRVGKHELWVWRAQVLDAIWFVAFYTGSILAICRRVIRHENGDLPTYSVVFRLSFTASNCCSVVCCVHHFKLLLKFEGSIRRASLQEHSRDVLQVISFENFQLIDIFQCYCSCRLLRQINNV